MDEEIERMNEEIIELREDNQRLRNMCAIVEQINDILSPIVNECKCINNNNSKINTKLNILKHKYKQLKESDNNISINNYNNCNNSQTIIDKIKKCSQMTPKLIIKRNLNNNCFDLINDNLMADEENIDDNNIGFSNSFNDKQNYLISLEEFGETFYRENGEEVKFELILPQIDNEIEVTDSSLIDNNVIKNKKINGKNQKKVFKQKSKRLAKKAISDRGFGVNDKQKTKNKNKVRPRNKISCNWPGCELTFRDKFNLNVNTFL